MVFSPLISNEEFLGEHVRKASFCNLICIGILMFRKEQTPTYDWKCHKRHLHCSSVSHRGVRTNIASYVLMELSLGGMYVQFHRYTTPYLFRY